MTLQTIFWPCLFTLFSLSISCRNISFNPLVAFQSDLRLMLSLVVLDGLTNQWWYWFQQSSFLCVFFLIYLKKRSGSGPIRTHSLPLPINYTDIRSTNYATEQNFGARFNISDIFVIADTFWSIFCLPTSENISLLYHNQLNTFYFIRLSLTITVERC